MKKKHRSFPGRWDSMEIKFAVVEIISNFPRLYPNKKLTAIIIMRLRLTAIFLCFTTLSVFAQEPKKFLNPADEYRPWVFWSWLNDMVTKKGITSDLEQFKRFGLRGTLVMLIGSETADRQMYENSNIPKPIVSQSPEFFDMWKFAAEESARLGLTITTQLGPGWCHSGGPWVKPEQAVQHIAYTEIQLKGNNRNATFFIDDQPAGNSKATAFHSEISDQNKPKWIQLSLKKPADIESVYLHPFDNKGIKGFGFPVRFRIEVASRADFSDKKVFFAQTSDLDNPGNTVLRIKNRKVKGQFIRLTAEKNYVFEKGNKNQYLLSFDEIEVISGDRNIAEGARVTSSGSIEQFGYGLSALNDGFSMSTLFTPLANNYTLLRPGYEHFTNDIAIVAYPDQAKLDSNDIIDLTKKATGRKIDWKIPDGNWVIRRYAIRNALAYNRPAPRGGKGLECDKLDKDAVDAMFAGMVGKFIKNSPHLAAKTIKAFEADSWEVGKPEWSGRFRDEFIKRRGYNPIPWLITYKTNQVVGNKDLTERFQNDMYLTQTDLFAENFFSHLADKADSLGMDFMTEPYIAPFDPIRMAGRIQVPMCEFWVSTEMMHTVRWASSAANTYGRKVVAAEAFTGRWNDGNWKMDPYAIKRAGDLAFANGVNKMIMHAAALQPWGMDHRPGMPMYFWGTIFIPGQTWWEPGKTWVNYLSRCQYMLSQGRNVADVVGLMPTLNWRGSMPEGLHKKYNYDLMSEETLLKDMDYSDGFFRLPSGARYRVLFLPRTNGKMTPEILEKLLLLARKGGTIVCQDKPSQSPRLTNYPQADQDVKILASQLWGKTDGKTIFENKVGKGTLVWINDIWKDHFEPERKYFLETRTKGHEFWDNSAVITSWSDEFMALLRSKALPDVEVVNARGKAMAWGGRPETFSGIREGEDAIAWNHRREGETDIYFVSSQVSTENNSELLFRIKDKVPQIWDPESGKLYSAVWSVNGDRVKINIPFTPFGSVFILFKPKDQVVTQPDLYRGNRYIDSITLNNKWTVTFPKDLGAPSHAQLTAGSLSESEIDGIKYFSGTATYQTTVNISRKQLKAPVALDLGEVKNLAEVIINGSAADTLWKPPFRADIGRFLKSGKNTITLKITNTWWNRFVGDQQLPEDLVWREKLKYSGTDFKGYELSEFPKWVWTGEQRPTKERVTFSPWRFVEKDSKLEPSGLIGPVKLLFGQKH